MKTCPNCHHEAPDDARWCPNCAADMSAVPSSAPSDPSPGTGWGWPQGGTPEAAAPPVTEPPKLPEPPAQHDPAAPAPVASTSPRVGEGALRFSHSGETYLLGYGTGFFGIWDRNRVGGPVMQFPRTDQGWNEAWNQFIGMEKRFIEVPQDGPPPDVRTTPARAFKPIGTLGGWLVVLLVASAATSVVTMLLRGVEITRLQDFRGGLTSAASVDEARTAANGFSVFSVLVIGVAVVVWLIWQFRAQGNLRRLGSEGTRFSPGWAVGWWFIPFANVVVPARVTAETWRASDPESGAIDWKGKRLSPLFVVWWGAWLLRIPLGYLAGAAAPQSGGSVEQLIRQRGYAIASDAATVVAALAAIVIVRQITGWQQQKSERMAAYGEAARTATPA